MLVEWLINWINLGKWHHFRYHHIWRTDKSFICQWTLIRVTLLLNQYGLFKRRILVFEIQILMLHKVEILIHYVPLSHRLLIVLFQLTNQALLMTTLCRSISLSIGIYFRLLSVAVIITIFGAVRLVISLESVVFEPHLITTVFIILVLVLAFIYSGGVKLVIIHNVYSLIFNYFLVEGSITTGIHSRVGHRFESPLATQILILSAAKSAAVGCVESICSNLILHHKTSWMSSSPHPLRTTVNSTQINVTLPILTIIGLI